MDEQDRYFAIRGNFSMHMNRDIVTGVYEKIRALNDGFLGLGRRRSQENRNQRRQLQCSAEQSAHGLTLLFRVSWDRGSSCSLATVSGASQPGQAEWI